jgi:hypothetical protein
VRRADNLTYFICRLSWSLEPPGPVGSWIRITLGDVWFKMTSPTLSVTFLCSVPRWSHRLGYNCPIPIFVNSFSHSGLWHIVKCIVKHGPDSWCVTLFLFYSDGTTQLLAGCLRDFRNKPFPTRAKIEYYQNTLTVCSMCFQAPATFLNFVTQIACVIQTCKSGY